MKSSFVKTGVTIKGMSKFEKLLEDMPEKVKDEAEYALSRACLDLQGKAQRLAPVLHGDLRGSAFSEVNGLDGVVGFVEPYALRQHEEVGYRHPKGGEAKFLETPYKENVEKYINSISAAMKRGSGG